MRAKIKQALNFVILLASIMGYCVWIGAGIGHGIVTGMRWAL